MSQSEMIQYLYDEICQQNTVYLSIIGLLVGLFAFFQWQINERKLNDAVDKKVDKILNKYHLDEIPEKYLTKEHFERYKHDELEEKIAQKYDQTTRLIRVAVELEKDSDAQNVLFELIIANVTDLVNGANFFSEYKETLNELLKYIERFDDEDKITKSVKNMIIFFKKNVSEY